jgi:hypothetical protein
MMWERENGSLLQHLSHMQSEDLEDAVNTVLEKARKGGACAAPTNVVTAGRSTKRQSKARRRSEAKDRHRSKTSTSGCLIAASGGGPNPSYDPVRPLEPHLPWKKQAPLSLNQ